jgi:5,10-methylenetetrahydromethanopterin reductase
VRELLTQYLGQQPHIMKASGVDPALIEAIGKVITWPATADDIRKAMKLVPDDAVQAISASGTPTSAAPRSRSTSPTAPPVRFSTHSATTSAS